MLKLFFRSYFMACCLVLFLTSCSMPGEISGNSMFHATSVPSNSKSDAGGISTEEKLRVELAKVQQMIAGMSLDQKLGQLLMVEYIGQAYQDTELAYMVSQQFVGGYLYQPGPNYNFDPPQNTISNVDAFATQAMSDAKVPLLIAIDEEGGSVDKTYTFYGPQPSAKALAQTGDVNAVHVRGVQAAKQLQSLAINADLAPVVDVQTVPDQDFPLLGSIVNGQGTGDRMFGGDTKTVETYAGAFLDGLQSNGVMGCLKHFPGLGSLHANEDPHDGLPTVARSRTDLDAIDLAPYKWMIQNEHPAMIMTTDVVTTAIDPDMPAELSQKVVTGVLRQELGYDGVVITDGLYMGGIQARWSLSQAAVLAIEAGNDIVEGPYTRNQVAEVVYALKQAIQQGGLSEARVDQSVQRILLMKAQYGLIK